MGPDLLVCDLDGTLVDASMRLDPELVAAFKRASAQGLAISLATGRMPRSGDRYRAELDIQLPVIYYNGALLRDPVTGRDLLSHQLPRGILTLAHDAFASAPVEPLFFRGDELYCLEVTPEIQSFCDDEALEPRVIGGPGNFLRLGAFIKGLFIGHPEELARLRATLEPLVGSQARLVRTAGRYLEILPADVSKGAALAELAAHLGVPLERVVAVGDHDNDIEMIRAAGVGVAMPHAPEGVRAVADRIAPTPEAGGLLALLGDVLPAYFPGEPRRGRSAGG